MQLDYELIVLRCGENDIHIIKVHVPTLKKYICFKSVP